MSACLEESAIAGLVGVRRPTYADARGFFRETLRLGELAAVLGRPFTPVQLNHARSRRGTLRGLHAAPWNKCVYVARGEVQAVVADLRPESPTFGAHVSYRLGEGDRAQLFVPAGCANAYLVLSEEADYLYLTDAYWTPGREFGVAWDDPDLAIAWASAQPLLSDRDQNNPRLADLFPGRRPAAAPR